ncbi:MAG: hydroxymethylglutaryl-CoA reductase [Candidatus Lokiarchaeota archaeon]|nr:hydroxymethylglutaryl-CoA reductase [Candidatus Lokiarchaeota archaeon]MBD3201458.1 hydroxymethylglutaryl-CoA reductase [Candidatus Lokiarchaeota archaeon]
MNLKANNSEKTPTEKTIPRTDGEKGIQERQEFIENFDNEIEWLKKSSYPYEMVKGNIENYFGVAKVPVGLAGPLLINGDYAKGEFFIPLATTEGSLVASYNRGMTVIKQCGGCNVKIFDDGMHRAPMFRFDSLIEAEKFSKWLRSNKKIMKDVAASTTSHGKLVDVDIYNLGRTVYVRFGFYTADAAGMNMVNLASYKICKEIRKNYPNWDRIESFHLASKFCSDKKYSQINILKGRGKKVTAEVEISKEILESKLRTNPERLTSSFIDGTLSAMYCGASSNGFHAANGLAALFIACGQDVANLAECHADIWDMRLTNTGVYFAITLPSLIIGTVGGGTNLPTQKECLNILGCKGTDKSLKFAEIVASVVLAGEISLVGAITSEEWVSAHEKYGRNRE